jgi:hypothetical protein
MRTAIPSMAAASTAATFAMLLFAPEEDDILP